MFAIQTESPARLERNMHCRRVAYLCQRVGEILSLERSVSLALVVAANLHHPSQSSNRNGDRLPQDAAFETVVIGTAEKIAGRQRGAVAGKLKPSLELAVSILNACNEFDETVEFAAYHGASVAAAIDEFFEDAGLRIEPRILDAFRRLTSEKRRPALDRELPVFPRAAARLLRSSPHTVTVADLESIAASDPVLAGRLVGAANSALLSSSWEIRELRQAIVHLGIPLARKALLSACLGTTFASRELAELWKRSTRVAAAAHELARLCHYDQETAYLAGLLHNVGMIVIQRSPAKLRSEERELLAAGFPRVYAESLTYGADHAEIGAKLLKAWGLPADIVSAVEFHHRPESTDSVLAGILYSAENFESAAAHEVENLLPEMRSASAAQIAGLEKGYRTLIDRESVIFALAG